MAIAAVKVVNNMPAVISDIQRKLSRMTYAGATVLDGYQATQIPIDTSALANNRTIETSAVGEMRVVSILKFHQDYAAAVHKKVGVNWKRSAAVDHWLADAASKGRDEIMDVMKAAL